MFRDKPTEYSYATVLERLNYIFIVWSIINLKHTQFMQECFKFRLFCPDKSSKFSSTSVLVTYELAVQAFIKCGKCCRPIVDLSAYFGV